jgi:uncharacterized membrane protein YsdA (DUF1294 family)/cold shock CspA family protein
MQPNLRSGKLIKWKDNRGFGFIQPVDRSQKVFLHISEPKDATRCPQENDTIYYHLTVNPNSKVRAYNAFILGARNNSPSLNNRAKRPNNRVSSFLIVEVLCLSFLPSIGSIHFTWTTRNPLPLFLYPFMSLLTYALYAHDKSRAKQNIWRIPEQTLHLCEIIGGWLGGFIAQRILRHKNQKNSYQIVF